MFEPSTAGPDAVRRCRLCGYSLIIENAQFSLLDDSYVVKLVLSPLSMIADRCSCLPSQLHPGAAVPVAFSSTAAVRSTAPFLSWPLPPFVLLCIRCIAVAVKVGLSLSCFSAAVVRHQPVRHGTCTRNM